MSDELLKRALADAADPGVAMAPMRKHVTDLAARVSELEAELQKAWAVSPSNAWAWKERAERAEAERDALRALLRTCPYEVNKPQSIADAQWVRDVRAALGDRHE